MASGFFQTPNLLTDFFPRFAGIIMVTQYTVLTYIYTQLIINFIGGTMGYVTDELGQQEACQFVTLPGEKLLIAKRQHWTAAFVPVVAATVLGFILAGVSLFSFLLGAAGIFVFISLNLFICTFVFTVIMKSIVDWFYHFYIVTNRKILEVTYTPFGHTVEDVFLDQVRITQIDVDSQNLISQLFDMGNVTLYFDRPSHDKTFVLANIQHPRHTGTFLADALETIMHHQPIWFKPRTKDGEKHDPYHFVDDYEPRKKPQLKMT